MKIEITYLRSCHIHLGVGLMMLEISAAQHRISLFMTNIVGYLPFNNYSHRLIGYYSCKMTVFFSEK